MIDGRVMDGEVWIRCSQLTGSFRRLASTADQRIEQEFPETGLTNQQLIEVVCLSAVSQQLKDIADELDFDSIRLIEDKDG